MSRVNSPCKSDDLTFSKRPSVSSKLSVSGRPLKCSVRLLFSAIFLIPLSSLCINYLKSEFCLLRGLLVLSLLLRLELNFAELNLVLPLALDLVLRLTGRTVGRNGEDSKNLVPLWILNFEFISVIPLKFSRQVQVCGWCSEPTPHLILCILYRRLIALLNVTSADCDY